MNAGNRVLHKVYPREKYLGRMDDARIIYDVNLTTVSLLHHDFFTSVSSRIAMFYSGPSRSFEARFCTAEKYITAVKAVRNMTYFMWPLYAFFSYVHLFKLITKNVL